MVNLSGSSSSDDSKKGTIAFLEGIFSIFEDLVSQTMNSNPNANSSGELSQLQQDLSKVKSQFTDEQSPVIDNATEQMESYKSRIRQLLSNKPQASVSSNLAQVREQLKNKKQ